MNKMLQLENETIIKNLDEIIEIISNNIQKMNVDENLLNLILQFITHVLAFKCLKQLNIKNKTPSEYGYPFPDQFTQEITTRTFKYQSNFEKYLGDTSIINTISNLNLNIKEKIKQIHEQIPQQTNISLTQSNSIQIDDDDCDIIFDPSDIDLLAIFDNNKINKNNVIEFNL